MCDQLELMTVQLVGVLALYENPEAPADIAQLSSRVLISPQKETTPPLLLQSPVSFTLPRTPKRYALVSGPPLHLNIPRHNSQISTVYLLTVLPWCLVAHCWRWFYYFYFTPLNRKVSCQQQMRCQDEICSMYCGACSSACMILPRRSTQLFPTSWERMMKREQEQLLPTPLHTACQSHEQVGLWDSSAFLPACRGLTPVSNEAPRSRFPLPPPSGVRRRKGKKSKTHGLR